MNQENTEIESKLIKILNSHNLVSISTAIGYNRTKSVYEKIKQAEGMILVHLKLENNWESKQELSTALIAIRSLLSDLINRVDTQCQSASQEQSNVILAKE